MCEPYCVLLTEPACALRHATALARPKDHAYRWCLDCEVGARHLRKHGAEPPKPRRFGRGAWKAKRKAGPEEASEVRRVAEGLAKRRAKPQRATKPKKSRRRMCARCGAPKPPRRGVRLCDACRPFAVQRGERRRHEQVLADRAAARERYRERAGVGEGRVRPGECACGRPKEDRRRRTCSACR